jgi:hypothetical protein
MIQRPDLNSLRRQVEQGISSATRPVADQYQEANTHTVPPPEERRSGGMRLFAAVLGAVFVFALVGMLAGGGSNQQPQQQSKPSPGSNRGPVQQGENAKTQESVPIPKQHLPAEAKAQPAPPTVTFRLKSNYPASVALSFFSISDRSRVWPDAGRIYVLENSGAQTHRLNCLPGEQICFGAWVRGRTLSPYWGAGQKGAQSCRDCCLTCPAQEASWILEPRDAVEPIPTLTWHIANNYPNAVALTFFSSTRSVAWPGGEQAYILERARTRSYRLNCQAGEVVCYGAWVHGNPSVGGWGVGYRRSRGCSNCCYTCDGGETRTITLDP